MDQESILSHFRKVVGIVVDAQVSAYQVAMRRAKSRLPGLHLFQQREPLVGPSCPEEYVSLVSQNRSGSRIQRLCAVNLHQRFWKPVKDKQRVGIPLMRSGIVGIEIDGAAEFALAGGEIPHAEE